MAKYCPFSQEEITCDDDCAMYVYDGWVGKCAFVSSAKYLEYAYKVLKGMRADARAKSGEASSEE